MNHLQNRLNNLFSALTPQQKAPLFFSASLEGDTIESDRILATVPIADYRGYDSAFRSSFDLIHSIAAIWGMTWWKGYTGYTAALGACLADDAAIETNFEQLKHHEARLIALELVLETLCQRHGYPADSIRKYASVSKFTAEIEPDLVYYSEVLAIFESLFNQP